MPPVVSPARPASSGASSRSVPRGPVLRARHGRQRRLRRLGIGVVAGALAVSVGVVVVHETGPQVAAASCTATDGGTSYTLAPEQVQNAATISAVAVRAGLPDHAVTVALATALQESKLINVSYGDRDSLGLFQQRPSQGWGTKAEIADPVYASTAFYRALTRLPSWQTDSVAAAAQAVQHSADGSAYAQWEDEARVLAIALTGEHPAVLTCAGGTLSTAKATTTSTRAEVSAAATAAFGPSALAPATTGAGLAAAAWLVASSQAFGITSVSYAGHAWSAATGRWVTPTPSDQSDQRTTVTYVLAPAPR